ncbi:efflux RND transporter periplasmic adaptor subunit [Bernardetia sp. Wsw4-3y2]|uniref:efflux RND transporter periplasmic adaptor subunit n=1 Tax=Bernardetia sp. Wsw4-3y2 TaxID=3127471 RepID=UPI0030CA6ACC
MKKTIFIIIGVVLVVAVAFRLYSNKSKINEAESYKEEIGNIPVNVVVANLEKQQNELKFTGTFNPIHEVQFGAELQGKITKIFAEEGTFLKAGNPIAKIDDSMLILQLKAQKNQLEVAKVSLTNQEAAAQKSQTDIQRFENLKKDNAVSDITYQNQKLGNTQAQGGLEISKTNVESAKISIQTTQQQIDKTLIKAPITGYFSTKNFEVGSIVSPNMPLGVITDISELELVVMIPEKQVILFKEGQKVELKADVFSATKFEGKVTHISVRGDQSHNFKMKISLKNDNKDKQIKAGMYGSVFIESTQNVEGIFIPSEVIRGNAGQTQVYVAENGKAVLKNVKTGVSIEDKVEIIEGLKAGDKIITSGINSLNDGITIQITK